VEGIMTLTRISLDWTRSDPKAAHEFEALALGVTFRAYRHRTDYGWSWFEITEDGKRSSINSGRQTELPRILERWL
jgi:hypothetical protein